MHFPGFVRIHILVSKCFLIRMDFVRPSFGIAFDIDGVIIRGNQPIGGSPKALRRLYEDCGM